MRFFSRLGELVISLFTLIGTIIFEFGEISHRIRSLRFRKIMEQGKKIVENIPAKSDEGQEVKKISEAVDVHKLPPVEDGTQIMVRGARFDPAEKESAILRLQISSAAFILISILCSFNFIPFVLFAVMGVLLTSFIVYILYYQIRVMYPDDFNAYRDFFLMYIAVGILIIIVASNPTISTALFFPFFPSFTILIFAVIAVAAIFIIFRIKYYRDYTFGEVIEAGKNTSQVRTDYDIRSNVKPDIYIVENNNFKVKEHDIVKLAIEGSIFSARGNKPTKIIGKNNLFNLETFT